MANPPLPEIVISGPINRVMYLEGRRYALDVVRAAGTDIRKRSELQKIIRNLTNYAAEQPCSIAAGIKIIIDLLKEG
ncbi:hypothetical protein KTQ74_07960 [Pseudomonas chlororaphis]|nr:hypothetical protein [Pseudomonas chlororaphis]